MNHLKPFHKTEEYFLIGPSKLNICVDDIFAKDIKTIIADVTYEDKNAATPDELDDGVKSIFCDGLVYYEVMAGIILMADKKVIGGYLGCDLSLVPEYRGKGLGKEIIIERTLREKHSPVWHLDTAAYTRAGLAAHQAAYNHVKNNIDEIEYRLERIYSGDTEKFDNFRRKYL